MPVQLSRVLFKIPTIRFIIYFFSDLYYFIFHILLRCFFFGPKMLLNILLSNTFNIFSSEFVVAQVLWLAYKTTRLTNTLFNVIFHFIFSNLDLNNGINP